MQWARVYMPAGVPKNFEILCPVLPSPRRLFLRALVDLHGAVTALLHTFTTYVSSLSVVRRAALGTSKGARQV